MPAGSSRPEADIRRSESSAFCSVRLYIGLLAEPSRPTIESYQGGQPTMRCAVGKSCNRTQGSGY